MKLLTSLSLVLLIAVSLSFTAPSAFAKTKNTTTVQNFGSIFNHIFNFSNTGGNTGGGSVTTGNASANQSVTNIINTTGQPCCTSVPEFGIIPGVIATISSAGSFLFLKRRYH